MALEMADEKKAASVGKVGADRAGDAGPEVRPPAHSTLSRILVTQHRRVSPEEQAGGLRPPPRLRHKLFTSPLFCSKFLIAR